MTREEAYNRIDAIIARHEIDDDYVTITSFLDYDALRMARKALEQEPSGDLIRRDDVFNALDRWYSEEGEVVGIYTMIENISSVKPQPCEDAISRQAAIKAIDEKAKRIKNADTLNGLAGAVGILFDLPSVKPQEPYKGMTNGQVHDMLYQMLVELKDGADRYGAEKWWNSPYEPQERSE